MSETAWLALFGFLFPFLTAVATAYFGWRSLQYKASKQNVETLEATVEKLTTRIKLLEELEEKCQAERLRLYRENLQLRDDKIELESKLN